MINMYRKIALFSLAIILGLVNLAIIDKEKHLEEGRIVYLDLAPVDPRSLMQGDYMALRFDLSGAVFNALPKKKEAQRWRARAEGADGHAVVKLDERNIGLFKSLYKGQALSSDEVLMRYRVRNGRVKFATNAFFFQEGDGKYYEPAQYGQFRVDDSGEVLLVAMYDKNLNLLGPGKKE